MRRLVDGIHYLLTEQVGINWKTTENLLSPLHRALDEIDRKVVRYKNS